jgi:hypothetical protein
MFSTLKVKRSQKFVWELLVYSAFFVVLGEILINVDDFGLESY